MRPALHFETSSSPARPLLADGASKVSQKAAKGKPHPGLAIGPVGAIASAPGDELASFFAGLPPAPDDDASITGADPPEPTIPAPPPDPSGAPSLELEEEPHEATHIESPATAARAPGEHQKGWWSVEDIVTHPSLSPFAAPPRTLS
jgi:hypothetical protein